MTKPATKSVQSMTGFSTAEGDVGGRLLRIEIKALNHRFLDLKIRMPRELSSAEIPLRAAIQARLSRGALDIKIETVKAENNENVPPIEANVALAKRYWESLKSIQKNLGLQDEIRTQDIASLPDVIQRTSSDIPAEEAWAHIEPLVQKALAKLVEMRTHEGKALCTALLSALNDMEKTIQLIQQRRAACEADYRNKLRTKISGIFEAHPIATTNVQAVLESRIAQELALLIDRTDIEEEVTRFQGHLDHFRKVMEAGGPVGRKLDFILQELNREINTLGNKAQDFSISEEVVQTKVRLEQLREQVMNLE